MGIFDNKGSIFGDKSGEKKGTGASPDFSDARSDSSASGKRGADFSDVSSGQSTNAPAAPGGSSYTVKSGDSLSKIARAHYGDAGAWKRIYEANRDKIDNPDLIYPGQELIIPGTAGQENR